MLRFPIDCDPRTAWNALHSPRVVGELYAPLLGMRPLLEEDLPDRWRPGDDAAVQLLALGRIPVGRQLIQVSDRVVHEGGQVVQVFRDSGIPLSGLLSVLDVWDHQMAVSALPGGRTLWRERLVFAGPGAALLWPALWATWQLRGLRVRMLASRWATDPGLCTKAHEASESSDSRR